MQHNGLPVNTQLNEIYPSGSHMDAKAFGQRVLRARLEMGALSAPVRQVSQSEVGAALGVTGVTVGRWEAGLKEPDLDTIARLAQVLKVNRAWLAFGDGPMRDVPVAEPNPAVLQETSADSQEISHHGTQRKGHRHGNDRGQTG
jgi:DNA-binding XRE family transcriptional regulator